MQKTQKNVLNLLIGLLLSALLAGVGCGGGSGPVLELPADPAAEPRAALESLFDQIALEIASAKPGSKAATRLGSQLKTAGGELANRTADGVRSRLSEVERVDGRIPLGALEQELRGLDSIERWDAAVHTALRDEIAQELDAARHAMTQREQQLSDMGEDDVLARLKLLSELSALSGTGSEKQARYAQQRDEILRAVSKEVEEAIHNEEYERAQDLLGIVQEVDPEDEDARRQKCEVDGKVILKRFGVALETGRVTRSVDMLTEFSQTDCFSEVREGLAESAGPMTEAFGMLGQEASASQQLDLAYQRYRDATQISMLLLERKAELPGIQDFLTQVEEAYERASSAGEYGLAWGYLSVLTEFGPTTPQIRRRLRMTRDEVAQRAVHGLTAYPFEDPKISTAKVGDAVASKVVQHIFRTIPSDVRIVEREQLERILEECKRTGVCGDLDAADFIVQGTVLDAKVETTEKSGSETRRVITGQEAVINPDHTRWAQMKERERNKTEEPPRTVTRDVTEDVTIQVTNVRKVGIISVSYRVVEASSGRVLFTDSLQTKQQFQDDGRQGIQLGNFKQETDFIELPPDIEILSGNEGLADKISEEIGTKLVDFLRNPEDQYAIEAKQFVEEGDFIGAARKAAYAIVLREIKSKEMGSLRDELKSYAMGSPAL